MPVAPVPLGRAAKATIGVVAVLAVIGVWSVMGYLAGQPPLPARPETDPFTGYVSGIADVVARLAVLATLGGLMAIIGFTPIGPHHQLTPVGKRIRRWVGRSAQIWLWSSLLLSAANAAYVNGVPLAYTLTPASWFDFISSTPAALAWFVSALVALATVVVAYRSNRYPAYVLLFLAATVSTAFVASAGNVSVGLNHDWATDASIWVSLAWAPLAGAAVAVVLRANDVTAPDSVTTAVNRLRRYQKAVPLLLVVAAAGHTVIAWQQLAGRSPFAGAYGWATIGFYVTFALLALSWVWRQVRGEADPARTTPVVAARSALRDVLLMVAYAALRTAENHLPPPRFLIPQSIQVNYLGYQVDIPATAARLASLGRPNLLWIGLAVIALASYYWGLRKVHAKGDHWPIVRTLFWTLGWVLVLFLATSGLWEYSTVAYSWHMLVHMTVNMLVPVLCLLGAPVTLLQAAARIRRHGQMPGPREVTVELHGATSLRKVLNPLVVWVLYVSSLFLVYMTPLFPWLMRYHWAHQLMLLYFMVTGYLFFDLVIGIDKWTNLPHMGRLALVIGVMPFHAMFAVMILQAEHVLGATFYQAIDIRWIPDLLADQVIAGQITWIVGEVPLLIVIIALALQWFQADSRDAVRLDRAQDSGLDDSYDAYNAMLQELSARDQERKLEERRLRR
ncbi:putative copper resistance protein D [Raineyella antarctica]|uniref:Putative copper resistance protein D n=1 Tax=Raineyella antarctica TaxID=1577474 RepID=A0A1G6GF46_9ACTN|nr:cytochrome c oxidase assembly protein [Raineyella antarctica]SDB80631.1 putative copper resistance protein D [Raineyella antarctica]